MTTRLEETERRRELARIEVAEAAEKRRLAAEAEEGERRRQAPLLDALEGMKEACKREERSRAGTLPLPPAEPLTCYRSPGGKFQEWGLCATILSEGQRPDICAQCQHGFQNAYLLGGFIGRLHAKAPVA